MKKTILFALLGALIIFVWQFISFAMPNFHKASMTYTPLQEEVLDALKESGLKEGMYMLGQPDPELSGDAAKSAMDQLEGKPWAVLNYQMENESSMVMPMIHGFLICIVISLFFFWLVLQQKNPKLVNRLFLGLSVGLISFFFVPYTNFIWFKEPDIWAYFLDGIVPWLAMGWLGHGMAKTKSS